MLVAAQQVKVLVKLSRHSFKGPEKTVTCGQILDDITHLLSIPPSARSASELQLPCTLKKKFSEFNHKGYISATIPRLSFLVSTTVVDLDGSQPVRCCTM